jgi:hypothetical protein
MSGLGSVCALSADQVEALWPEIEPFLIRFERETATVTASALRAMAQQCEAQFWAAQAASGALVGICVTRVYQTDLGRFCTVFVAQGALAPYLAEGMALIEDWARGLGCRAVEIIGRRGWERALKGYVPRAVVLEKRLTEFH